MRRDRYFHDEHVNHDRWLVSYADFITLMFAFFVVMYSISSVSEGKYRVLSDSLTQAFDKNLAPVMTETSPLDLPIQQSVPFEQVEGSNEAKSVEGINEEIKIELPLGEYETLSGFLLQQFGRIPEEDDELFYNTSSNKLKFTIIKATERRIESVLVEFL